MPRSELVDEDDLEEILIMDWRFEAGMNKQERHEVSEFVAKEITKGFDPIHKKLDSLSSAGRSAAQGVPAHYWRNTALIALGSVVLAAGVTWIIAAWQVGSARDQEFVSLRISKIVDEKLEPLKKELSDIGKDVAKIKGADGISKNIAPPALNVIIQNVNEAMKSKPTEAGVNDIAAQLSEAQKSFPTSAEVWKTTGNFINYKAVFLVPSAPVIQKKATGVPCSFQFGGPLSPGLVFRSCEIDLESIDKNMASNFINGRPASFIFVNCLVRYRGGALQTHGPIIFQNSVLRFEVSSVPPPNGVKVMKQLTLAMADNGKISLSP